jgi:hypothetical protein
MDEELRKAIERHSAGATVVHTSRFSDLVTYQNEGQLDKATIQKFVVPFYMNLLRLSEHTAAHKEHLLPIRDEVTSALVKTLLGDFNWRTRSTGSFFAALFDYTDHQETIGRLLLKSEVCYAGSTYALTLAAFNNDHSLHFINEYLDYYLTQPQLHFDQGEVLGALLYLDQINGSSEAERHMAQWKLFCGSPTEYEGLAATALERCTADMKALKEIQAAVRID